MPENPPCRGYHFEQMVTSAPEGIRTPTPLRIPEPKSGASASSATSARMGQAND